MTRFLRTGAPSRARLTFILIGTIALTACATSTDQSPSLFVLDGDPTAVQRQMPADAPTLVVRPVDVAGYLDQGGLVYQTGPHRIVVANDNRWASSLSAQLTDSLYGAIASRASGIDVERSAGASNTSYQLRTRVDRFIGHYDGSAHIAGQWQLMAPDGSTLDSDTFDRQIPLDEDGYPALVSSLSTGWQAVADHMTMSLEDQLSRSSSKQ